MRSLDDLTRSLRSHRCFSHPLFRHGRERTPGPATLEGLLTLLHGGVATRGRCTRPAPAGRRLVEDLADQEAVEAYRRTRSDFLRLEGADRAHALFAASAHRPGAAAAWDLGVALALELVCERGEAAGDALTRTGRLPDPLDLFLEARELVGGPGARSARDAALSAPDDLAEDLLLAGAGAFLDTLGELWDALDAALGR